MARVSLAARKERTNEMEFDGAELPAQGLVRGLQVLRAFRAGEGSLSHTEIKLRTGLPNPTVSRLTQTLTALGYLSYIPKFGRYTLGPAVVSLCHSLLNGMPYRIHARPILQDLADRFKLPVSLGARDHLDMINIETVRHALSPTARFDIGARLPIESTAMGRAYLYALPAHERNLVVRAILKKTDARHRKLVEKRIQDSFDSLQRDGFCLSLGDWRRDVWGAGAPVLTTDGVALAINCGGHPNDIKLEFLKREIGPRLASAAAEVNHMSLV
jgi:DNA-binding IclR family transcriptional regulator